LGDNRRTVAEGARTLVTGGAGFIGSHLVERLVAGGASVTVLDDLKSGPPRNLAAVLDRVEVVRGDVTTTLVDPGFVAGFDVVFHLAANPYIPPSVDDPLFDFELNLGTTLRLLEALRAAPRGPRLVFTSSAAVYGNPRRLPIREDDPTVPISPYGVSKLAAERYVAVYADLYDLTCSSVRLFSVYGPRQRKQVVYDLLDRLHADPERLEVYGDGTQERDFVFVGDVADAMVAVADRAPGRGEAINVASGTSTSIAALVGELSGAMGVHPELVWSGSVRPGDAQNWSVDTAALNALPFAAAVPLADGLRATLAWYEADRREG